MIAYLAQKFRLGGFDSTFVLSSQIFDSLES